METKATQSIHIRRSMKYEPIISRVEQIATQRHSGEFTATLMDMLELGLESYDFGFRVVDHKLLNINESNVIVNETTATMNIRREVGRSVFPGLAGSLIDLKRYEKNKSQPDPKKINFYTLASKALSSQHAKFRHLTNAEVENIFKTIAPILKDSNLAKTKAEVERIIESNKQVLLDLINKTGVGK